MITLKRAYLAGKALLLVLLALLPVVARGQAPDSLLQFNRYPEDSVLAQRMTPSELAHPLYLVRVSARYAYQLAQIGPHIPLKERKMRVYILDLQLGANVWVQPQGRLGPPDQLAFLAADRWRSRHVGLEFFPTEIDLASRRFQLRSALCFDFYNYRLEQPVRLVPGNSSLGYEEQATLSLERNKFAFSYFRLPILFRFSTDKYRPQKGFRIEAGPWAALRMESWIKQRSFEDGLYKERNRFGMHNLQFGLTGKIGFKFLEIYAHYPLLPTFQPGYAARVHHLAFGVRVFGI